MAWMPPADGIAQRGLHAFAGLADDLPPFPPRMLPAKPELILDGRLAPLVIGITGIRYLANSGFAPSERTGRAAPFGTRFR